MKDRRAHEVPEKTEAEKFEALASKLVQVPKDEVEEVEKKRKEQQDGKQKPRR